MSLLLKKAKRILIVGGTFDPPHMAHLIQPQLAADQIGADVLLYIPVGRQPQKSTLNQATAEHRLAMVRLMAAQCPHAFVHTIEIDRMNAPATATRPSYTLDTLLALRAELGDVTDGGPELRMLIGADQAAGFYTWHQPLQVASLARPAVMPRPPWTCDNLLKHLSIQCDTSQLEWWRSCYLDLPLLDVTSTLIRQRRNRGLSLAGLVTPAVEDYIRQHHLYR